MKSGLQTIGFGRAAFAVTLFALGVLGLVIGDFTPIWRGVPAGFPAREPLAYVCAIVCLISGIGLIWQRSAASAAGVLLVYLVSWLLVINVPQARSAPTQLGAWYGFAETVVFAASAWTLLIRSAAGRGRPWMPFVTDVKALRIARGLFGLALVFFGASHFVYVNMTVPLVPVWIPGAVFWAYFFGCTYIAAGLALLADRYARLASSLVTLQMGLFTVFVWLPRLAAGETMSVTGSTWQELVFSWTLTAAAWVIADSWRGTPSTALDKG